ncbi:DUF1336-domain-containing protein [Fragilariopsis cylindrus CCMP1102]|uniref:DUF1336-domain-containing protein n=1 Tax=Fragilariopsis cylindrus CCMP1102 TaxID=635003 RepID=A0A1E7FN25_9STRA|nr:DUF1336-domain-containing protein [Fragilariopsis cylindrus CCMP1102]|eukprot:OEU19558.1 DUF1336-domain-containing protein [Fragilariopsis cylindrus CCMP1102]
MISNTKDCSVSPIENINTTTRTTSTTTSDMKNFIGDEHNDSAWSKPQAERYSIRGKTYIKDKIKQPSTESAFQLFAVDLINVDTPMYSGMCKHPNERIQIALQREREEGNNEDDTTTTDDVLKNNDELPLPEFVFAINLCIPKAADNNDNSSGGLFYHAVFYFGVDKEQMNDIQQCTTPFGRVMNKYIFGNTDNDINEYRNKTLKLIPHVVEGNYIIKHAVGTTPTILGKEMTQYYVQDERYLEVIIDISSNTIANSITKLCLRYITNLTINLMFVVEGQDESTLPERILGGVQIKHLDFITEIGGDGKRTVTLNESTSTSTSASAGL